MACLANHDTDAQLRWRHPSTRATGGCEPHGAAPRLKESGRDGDGNHYEWQNWLKQYVWKFCGDLMERERLVGENLYAKHSIGYKFEDIEIIGSKDYDYILKTIYGDYMQLPKEEDRISHSFVLE